MSEKITIPFYHFEYTFLVDRLEYARDKAMQSDEYAVLYVNKNNEQYSLMLDIQVIGHTVEDIVKYAESKVPEEFSGFDEVFGAMVKNAETYPEKEKFQNVGDGFEYGYEKKPFSKNSSLCKIWAYRKWL